MSSQQTQRVRDVIEKQVTPVFKGVTDVPTLRRLWETLSARSVVPTEVRWEPVMANGVSCEWVAGPSPDPAKAIFYLHGGAYLFGSAATYREVTGRLSMASRLRVLAADYRLAPEYPFPAALDDALAAYHWLLKNGFNAEQVVFAGSSAGGGLALAAMLALRDAGDNLPAAAILFSPFTDGTFSGASYRSRAEADPLVSIGLVVTAIRHYTAGKDPGSPLVSPLFANLAGLPPMLVHVGRDEILLDDSAGLAERAKVAGVDVELQVWDGMWHDFQRFGGRGVVEAQESIDLAAEFAQKQVSKRLQAQDT
jgi:epsilon-lactone hydrolase